MRIIHTYPFTQEGLKAHEGGQQANPFDMFQNFFGGREFNINCISCCLLTSSRQSDQQQQTRRGPSSLTEFEVKLSDMFVHHYPLSASLLICIQLQRSTY
jgi:DnaJ-related protein SCJ1